MYLFSAMPINNKFKGFQVNFFVCGHPDSQGPTVHNLDYLWPFLISKSKGFLEENNLGQYIIEILAQVLLL